MSLSECFPRPSFVIRTGQRPSVNLSHCAMKDQPLGVMTKVIALLSHLLSGTAQNLCKAGLALAVTKEPSPFNLKSVNRERGNRRTFEDIDKA